MSQAAAELGLIGLARSGDAAAFESLVRTRMDAVYRLSLAIVGDESDAADAAQESFISAWRQLPRLREPDRFDAWLQRVVVNTCRQSLRTRRRRRLREIPTAALVEMEGSTGAASGAERSARDAALLRVALDRLNADQRGILAMHHLEGRPVAEIASILGIPEGTAKSRLFHARAALDRALRREEQP